MNEDFIPYELAVKLKEKGFKDNCIGYYDYAGEFHYNYESAISNKEIYFCHNKYDNIWHRDLVDIPTISQVLKWLREEEKIFIHIDIYENDKFDYFFGIAVQGDETWEMKYVGEEDYKTYELAALAGVEYCLDNLI